MASEVYFTLTWEHIRLLANANVTWNDMESGAPTIDPKRPYGNSDVSSDMARILGITRVDDVYLTKADQEHLWALHREVASALQVVLCATSFEVGRYASDPYSRNWHKVDDAKAEGT